MCEEACECGTGFQEAASVALSQMAEPRVTGMNRRGGAQESGEKTWLFTAKAFVLKNNNNNKKKQKEKEKQNKLHSNKNL